MGDPLAISPSIHTRVVLIGAVMGHCSALLLHTLGAKAASPSGKMSANQVGATTCSYKWTVVASPHPNNINSGLSGVAVVSATNIWAVGGQGSQSHGGNTMIEHWNGAQWQIVPSANPSTEYNRLNAVSAISATNVWAVGFTSTGSTQNTLIEHWNGVKWSVVPSPATNIAFLSGIAAVSPSNIWAVGAANTFGQTLIEHWNGVKWSIVPSPNLSGDLRDVAADSASDVWAVGYTGNSASQTLIEHWNGASWHVVKSINVGSSPDLIGVAEIAPNNAWTVGSNTNSSQVIQTLTEHWNGINWSAVASPSPGSFSTQLLDVAAVSALNVWAVGYANGAPLVEHYHCVGR